eukprot:scaffold172267_cov70-Attheya_sp.AAC.3
MGCGSSKNANHRAEADTYKKRKQNGFKDPGLEKHREDCVKQKKNLRHVQNPDQKRKQKQANKKMAPAKGGGGAGGEAIKGGQGGGLTQAQIQAQRKKLKHRT